MLWVRAKVMAPVRNTLLACVSKYVSNAAPRMAIMGISEYTG